MHSEQFLFLCSSLVSRLINGNRKPNKEQIGRILVIKLDEIGDMIYTLHVLRALRDHYPEARIDVMCRKLNRSLVKTTGIENIIENDKFPSGRYDVVLDMRGNWTTMWRALAGKCRLRFDRGTIRLRNKLSGGQKHERLTNWEIAEPLLKGVDFKDPELPCPPDQSAGLDALLRTEEIEVGKYVVMHTGARDPIRRWPLERFSELSKRLYIEKGLQTVICGGPEETEVIERVLQGKHVLNLAGKTSFVQLSYLCAKAALFVGNESGPLHFAVINRTPLVALFGAGVEDVFYPYHNKQLVIHRMDLPVGERLKAISVQDVWDALPDLE